MTNPILYQRLMGQSPWARSWVVVPMVSWVDVVPVVHMVSWVDVVPVVHMVSWVDISLFNLPC